VTVETQHIEGQSFKAKLPTLLQSDDRPDFFYSWGGGVMQAQVDSGALRDVTEEMNAGWADTFSPAAVNAFTYKDEIWGAPFLVNMVGFWYNKRMFEEAGVNADDIKTWDDLLAAVEKLKAAGFVPIGLGGSQKWPIHFYYTLLMLRLGGEQAFVDAVNEKGDGFASEVFVDAGKKFGELIALEPFQPGFIAADQNDIYGKFGDEEFAMTLMGNWHYARQRTGSVDGEGLSDEELGWFPFPTVPGGAGKPTDTLGGINGWLFTKDAPQEAIDFVKYFLSAEVQADMASRGWLIPTAIGADQNMTDPFSKLIAEQISNSTYHQIFYDQMLGPDVGLVVNDMAAELALGNVTPEEAAANIQEAWLYR
jgi:raffinose/stachyose/melibiose transport system substrate-binding protein